MTPTPIGRRKRARLIDMSPSSFIYYYIVRPSAMISSDLTKRCNGFSVNAKATSHKGMFRSKHADVVDKSSRVSIFFSSSPLALPRITHLPSPSPCCEALCLSTAISFTSCSNQSPYKPFENPRRGVLQVCNSRWQLALSLLLDFLLPVSSIMRLSQAT